MSFDKVLIFGKGKVGTATQEILNIDADFVDKPKNIDVSDVSFYDLAIICVPSLTRGHNDYLEINQCLDRLKDNFDGLIALRSTVSPLYLKEITEKYSDLNIIYFPEFLKQRSYETNTTPWITVLGGKLEFTERFAAWLNEHNYGAKELVHLVSLEESALIKLFQNAGLALKVTYANVIFETCKMFKADFEKVKFGVGSDRRIGMDHLNVPGEDGFGFGGHCLPKDLNCLSHVYDHADFWSTVIAANQSFLKKNNQNT